MLAQDADAAAGDAERTCWCLFRLSVLSQAEGGKHFHRESYGRFSTDAKQADSASLGWNDFLSMDAFSDPAAGYLQARIGRLLSATPSMRYGLPLWRLMQWQGLAIRGGWASRGHAAAARGCLGLNVEAGAM